MPVLDSSSDLQAATGPTESGVGKSRCHPFAANTVAQNRLHIGRPWLVLGLVLLVTLVLTIVTLGTGPGIILSLFFLGMPAAGILWSRQERRR